MDLEKPAVVIRFLKRLHDQYTIGKSVLLLLFLFVTILLKAQDLTPRLDVRYITDDIKIDGVMDEAIWKAAAIADNFWQFFPTDSVRAHQSTEVRMLYDETTIYVGIRANSDEGKYIVSSLRRDFS